MGRIVINPNSNPYLPSEDGFPDIQYKWYPGTNDDEGNWMKPEYGVWTDPPRWVNQHSKVHMHEEV